MSKKTTNVLNQDIKSYSLDQIKGPLELLIKLQRPAFLWGPVGVGKSELLAQIAASQNRKLIDIRLSQMDMTDLRGIPIPNKETRQTEWMIPSMLPSDPEDDSIIFFDELNCAMPSILATAYQLILDRKVGDYTLPKKVAIVAAGNRDSDKGITFRMPSPLLNRFVHLEVKFSIEAFLLWAKDNNIHKLVISYLENNRKDLNSFDPLISNRSFATSRTWKWVSDILYSFPTIPSKKSQEYKTLEAMITGTIGLALGNQFLKWVDLGQYCPSLKDIAQGKVKKLELDDDSYLSVLNSLMHELGSYLKDELEKHNMKTEKGQDDFYKMWDNIFAFVMHSSEGNKELCNTFVALSCNLTGVKPSIEKSPILYNFVENPANVSYLTKVKISQKD